MSKRGYVLVEGQTEERFVKQVLAPHFYPMDLYLEPTILVTKYVKHGADFKGGVLHFAQFKRDLELLMKGTGDALVTTMLDYYRLPNDFPGMSTRPMGTPRQRVMHVEQAMFAHFAQARNLDVFLALHEFEALLFSSDDELPRALTKLETQPAFVAERNSAGSPEEINETPEGAPSKRIERLFPGYRKLLHGPTIAERIGLARIRSSCPHFNSWVERLETYARA